MPFPVIRGTARWPLLAVRIKFSFRILSFGVEHFLEIVRRIWLSGVGKLLRIGRKGEPQRES
jgi:hypothetical protein